MAYLAIARKYRPATFDEIVGQEHVTRTLKNAIEGNRVHHAYLFCGARGVGKTTAARALARSLNCVEGPTATPCGVCTSCTEIANSTSPDLIEIDGASNNSVDDIRDLRETVHYAPTQGRWKIYLIDEVHMLSKAAFNALLKTLEEPPPHVVFIFATTEPNKILDTILSRVQRFDFKRIPVPGVVDRLRQISDAEGATLSETALRMIARAGEGSMRDAQSHLDKVISFGGGSEISDVAVAETLGLIDRTLLHDMVRGLVHGEPDTCLTVVHTVYSYGFELSQFTGELLETLRHGTLLALSPRAAQFVDLAEDEQDTLREIMKGVPTEQTTRIFDALIQVHDQVSRSSRPRIVLDMAIAKLATTSPAPPIRAMLTKLDELERRIRQGKPKGVVAAARRPREDRTDAKPAERPVPQASQGPQEPVTEPKPRHFTRRKPAVRKKQPPPPPPKAETPPPMEEPPPLDEIPPGYLEAEPEEASHRPAQDPWVRCREELLTLGNEAAPLTKARIEVRRDTITFLIHAGPKLSRARKALDIPVIAHCIQRHFPRQTHREVAPELGTGSDKDRQQSMKQKVLRDPEIKRVLKHLRGEVEYVISLADDTLENT